MASPQRAARSYEGQHHSLSPWKTAILDSSLACLLSLDNLKASAVPLLPLPILLQEIGQPSLGRELDQLDQLLTAGTESEPEA